MNDNHAIRVRREGLRTVIKYLVVSREWQNNKFKKKHMPRDSFLSHVYKYKKDYKGRLGGCISLNMYVKHGSPFYFLY